MKLDEHFQGRDFAGGHIRASRHDHVGLLVIDRPDRRNAVTLSMWQAIPDALRCLVAEAGARVVIISGAGARDFSAGADISEFATVRNDSRGARAYEAANSAAFAAIREARVPVIAAIRGVCYGGGFGIAAACDLRLGDESAVFAVPAARLGLAYPADAVSDFLRGLGAQQARKALFTGAAITASQAHAASFLLDVVAGDVEEAAFSLARQIAQNAPRSVQAAKLAILASEQQDELLFSEAEILGASTFESLDYAEGRQAFAERRKPVFTGD